jgi:hypothetical protein
MMDGDGDRVDVWFLAPNHISNVPFTIQYIMAYRFLLLWIFLLSSRLSSLIKRLRVALIEEEIGFRTEDSQSGHY